MVFDRVLAQEAAVQILVRALETDRVHHAYRFEGPDGVGKELAAFALAQSLVCTAGGRVGCGACSACRRAVALSDVEPRVPRHPDVLLVQRGLYPPSSLGTSSTEATGIGVEQIRRIVLGRAGYPPHEGRALVVIVRDADELTVQAGNALLKTLEEPGPKVHFVLLTSRPKRLLDTIRSRTLAVRFAPLPDEVVASILERSGHPTAAAPLAQGSASLALALADAEATAAREGFIREALTAAAAPNLDAAVALAAAGPRDRDSLKEQLLHLGQTIALRARDLAGTDVDEAARGARQHAAILQAMSALERNGQPALVLEAMLSRLQAI